MIVSESAVKIGEEMTETGFIISYNRGLDLTEDEHLVEFNGLIHTLGRLYLRNEADAVTVIFLAMYGTPDLNEVTPAMREAGNSIASNLITASCRNSMAGLGCCKELDMLDFPESERAIIQWYLDKEIVSVEAIYRAMINCK